ncbi:MAG TPA: hypothetical protein VG294_19710 [Solirubrobacteraceae bacterium]|jgi:hypothetical protein|nr:hypothetical protein [Solirubrobacteraceae bacterium]
MTSFTVDPNTLAALQSTISGLYSELDGMHKVAPGYHGMIGGSPLEDEVGHFLNAWHSGVALIEGDMQKVVQRLGEAAQAYGTSEACIATASAG